MLPAALMSGAAIGAPILASLVKKAIGGSIGGDITNEKLNMITTPAAEQQFRGTLSDEWTQEATVPQCFVSQNNIINSAHNTTTTNPWKVFSTNFSTQEMKFYIINSAEVLMLSFVNLTLYFQYTRGNQKAAATHANPVRQAPEDIQIVNSHYHDDFWWADLINQMELKMNGTPFSVSDAGKFKQNLIAARQFDQNNFHESGCFYRMDDLQNDCDGSKLTAWPKTYLNRSVGGTVGEVGTMVKTFRFPISIFSLPQVLHPSNTLEITLKLNPSATTTTFGIGNGHEWIQSATPAVNATIREDTTTTQFNWTLDSTRGHMFMEPIFLRPEQKNALERPIGGQPPMHSLSFHTYKNYPNTVTQTITGGAGSNGTNIANFSITEFQINLVTTGVIPNYIIIIPSMTYGVQMFATNDASWDVNTQNNITLSEAWRMEWTSILINQEEYMANPMANLYDKVNEPLEYFYNMRRYRSSQVLNAFRSNERVGFMANTVSAEMRQLQYTLANIANNSVTGDQNNVSTNGAIESDTTSTMRHLKRLSSFGYPIINTRQLSDMNLEQLNRAGTLKVNLVMLNQPPTQNLVAGQNAQKHWDQDFTPNYFGFTPSTTVNIDCMTLKTTIVNYKVSEDTTFYDASSVTKNIDGVGY
jgi:hypothetical protein